MAVSETDEYRALDDTDDGVDPEPEDSDDIEIHRPFNPEQIKVRTNNILVDHLVSRIRHNEIDLSPDFQRMRGIWSDARKSRLIESLLLRIPIPVFYVSADDHDNWAVVDGVQRMSTIYDYVRGEFSFSGLEYLEDLYGLKYDDLPRNMHRRISETQLIVNIIEPGTPVAVMFNIFHRINTGGMTLNQQEIRHALNPGPVRHYLKQLAASKEFLRATASSIPATRMADRECALRFLAFYISGWENYSENDLDGFLAEAMRRLNRMSQENRDELEVIFRRTMAAAADIFGDDAFRKRTSSEDRRQRVNKALLEAWSVGLARRSPEDVTQLVQNRKRVQERFTARLSEDWEFYGSVSTSTGTPQRVWNRFGVIAALIEEFL